MKTMILYFSPTQLSDVTGIPLEQIFKEIREGTISYLLTDEGIRIPVTYQIDTDI